MILIAIDFDGTIVDHCFPDIGAPVPGAFEYMKKFQELGAKLILWTMRSDGQDVGDVLTAAVEFCRVNDIEFYGVNENPTQVSWTASPKVYAQLYIDDAAFGCPLRENPRMDGRPFVDWNIVGPAVLSMLVAKRSEIVTYRCSRCAVLIPMVQIEDDGVRGLCPQCGVEVAAIPCKGRNV